MNSLPASTSGPVPSRRWFVAALLAYCAIAISLTGPALIGHSSVLPEGYLDRDLLYLPAKERAGLRPFGDATPMLLDLPREYAVAAGLQQGRLDTWNPWSAAGSPLWAEQGSPFFPTKLIYYLYPHHATLMAALAARLVVAALGMFFLARALGLTPTVSLFTGALFEYSGILAEQLAFAASSAMYVLPWALLGARKLAAGGVPGAVAISGLALGIAALGGHPSFTLLVALGFGAWLLGEWAYRRAPLADTGRQAALAAASGMLALLIAAVALLPFCELVWLSDTYKDASIGEAIWRDRLDWTRDAFTAALLVPSLMTAVRDTILFHYWPYAAGVSIGFAALLLAIAGAPKLRQHWGAIAVAVLGVGLTLSPIGLQWLHEVPGVRLILPGYCYVLIVLPLCLAAGFGLQSLAAAPRQRLILVPFAVLLWGLLVLVVALLGGCDALQGARTALADSGLYRKILRGDIRYLGDWRVLLSPAAGVAAVVAYVLLCRRSAARAAAAVAIIALVEAAAVRIPTIEFERSYVLRSAPSGAVAQLTTLLSGGAWRFIGWPPGDVAVANTSLLFELRDIRSTSALVPRRLSKYLDLAGAESRATAQVPASIQLPMLGLAAVKYVVYGEGTRLALVENPFALPRFRVARDVVPAADATQSFEILARLFGEPLSGVPAGWSRRAVIEGISADEAARARPAPGASATRESVRLVAEPDPQTIVLEADLAAPGFVIVADTYYPGWRATVNGEPAAVRPADLLFRAIHVPAGRHTIVMKYEPYALRVGAALTLIGLLIAAGLLVRARAPAQRRGPA